MSDTADLARLHWAAFTVGRPWRADEFDTLLVSPHVSLHQAPHGFALTRLVAGEAELLTLAVDPAHQRQGIAQALLKTWLEGLRNQAETAFLEVAADNGAAQALYSKLGFVEVARRAGYYSRPDGPSVDAVIMRMALTKG